MSVQTSPAQPLAAGPLLAPGHGQHRPEPSGTAKPAAPIGHDGAGESLWHRRPGRPSGALRRSERDATVWKMMSHALQLHRIIA